MHGQRDMIQCLPRFCSAKQLPPSISTPPGKNDGNSPLHRACMHGDADVVQCLLRFDRTRICTKVGHGRSRTCPRCSRTCAGCSSIHRTMQSPNDGPCTRPIPKLAWTPQMLPTASMNEVKTDAITEMRTVVATSFMLRRRSVWVLL